jgi:hypothetical protein
MTHGTKDGTPVHHDTTPPSPRHANAHTQGFFAGARFGIRLGMLVERARAAGDLTEMERLLVHTGLSREDLEGH